MIQIGLNLTLFKKWTVTIRKEYYINIMYVPILREKCLIFITIIIYYYNHDYYCYNNNNSNYAYSSSNKCI